MERRSHGGSGPETSHLDNRWKGSVHRDAAWRGGGRSARAEALGAEVIMPRHRNPPEGDGGPNLDYEWIAPDQSAHIAKAILLDLAANGYAIVKQGP